MPVAPKRIMSIVRIVLQCLPSRVEILHFSTLESVLERKGQARLNNRRKHEDETV